MGYFQHENISSSDLTKFLKMIGEKREDPPNLEAIFSFGTLFHKTILEPHMLTSDDHNHVDYDLARRMHLTFFQDKLCRMMINRYDFEREREFYNRIEVGGMAIQARCKADGYCGGMSLCLELKGLRVSTQKAFDESLINLDYDRNCVHYLLTSRSKTMFVVGISKSHPDRLFKRVVMKHDEFYAGGEEKLIQTLHKLRQVSPEDVELLKAA